MFQVPPEKNVCIQESKTRLETQTYEGQQHKVLNIASGRWLIRQGTPEIITDLLLEALEDRRHTLFKMRKKLERWLSGQDPREASHDCL